MIVKAVMENATLQQEVVGQQGRSQKIRKGVSATSAHAHN